MKTYENNFFTGVLLEQFEGMPYLVICSQEEVVVASEELKERVVTIRYDGQEYKVLVPPDKGILESALDQGIDLPYSCQSGLCTACRGKALSGKVKLDEEEGLSQSERAEGYVLTCVGHPLTDDVVIEIG